VKALVTAAALRLLTQNSGSKSPLTQSRTRADFHMIFVLPVIAAHAADIVASQRCANPRWRVHLCFRGPNLFVASITDDHRQKATGANQGAENSRLCWRVSGWLFSSWLARCLLCLIGARGIWRFSRVHSLNEESTGAASAAPFCHLQFNRPA
jgi:hypothetical protein